MWNAVLLMVNMEQEHWEDNFTLKTPIQFHCNSNICNKFGVHAPLPKIQTQRLVSRLRRYSVLFPTYDHGCGWTTVISGILCYVNTMCMLHCLTQPTSLSNDHPPNLLSSSAEQIPCGQNVKLGLVNLVFHYLPSIHTPPFNIYTWLQKWFHQLLIHFWNDTCKKKEYVERDSTLMHTLWGISD